MVLPVVKPPKLPFKFGRKKPRDLVMLELDENELKLACLKVKGMKREIAYVATHAVKGLMDDGASALIQQMVQRSGANDPRVYVTVPLPLVITRNIEIPSQDPAEIREIVNLQASRHTPYARAEIIVDMLNLGVVRERYTKVLLVIVPKEAVNRQIHLIEKASLKLEKVVFPPESIALLAAKMGGVSDSAPLAVLHMDQAFTTFLVVQSGRLLFVRGIHLGARQLIEEKDMHVDRFQDELEKSLETYSSDEVGALPKMALLTGVLTEITDLDDVLTETLKMPIKRPANVDHFHLSSAAKTAIQSSKMVSFLDVLAPLALYDRIRVDLTSEEKKLKIQLEKRAHEMLKMGVLILILFVLGFFHVTAKISFKKTYLKQITTHYLPVRESAKQLEQLLAKTELVKSYLASRGYSLETLTTLFDVTPLDIRLNEIKYDESTSKFSIKGTSSVTSSVFSYVTELDKTQIFKNVKPKHVTNRSEAGKDVADFEIECMVEAGPR